MKFPTTIIVLVSALALFSRIDLDNWLGQPHPPIYAEEAQALYHYPIEPARPRTKGVDLDYALPGQYGKGGSVSHDVHLDSLIPVGEIHPLLESPGDEDVVVSNAVSTLLPTFTNRGDYHSTASLMPTTPMKPRHVPEPTTLVLLLAGLVGLLLSNRNAYKREHNCR